MSYFNDNITITLTAVEMATIREALRYAAEQVHDSDIPVFESFESLDKNTGKYVFDEAMHDANQAKADLAFELADTLDLIEADSTDWKVTNSDAKCPAKESLSVWCRHNNTGDFGTPLVREFIWNYTPKQHTVYVSVLEDCVMPLNTQIAIHWVPYDKLDDKSVVTYYDLDDLRNRTPIITGDADTDNAIVEAIRNFVSYHG